LVAVVGVGKGLDGGGGSKGVMNSSRDGCDSPDGSDCGLNMLDGLVDVLDGLNDLVVDVGPHDGLLLNDLLDNPADMDLRLNTDLLGGDLGVLADGGKDGLLGHKWSEVSGLGGTNNSNGWLGNGDGGSPGLDDLGVSNGDGSQSGLGLNNGLDWSNGNSLDSGEDWLGEGRDGWLDDLRSVSGHDWLGLVVNGLLDWDGNMGDSWLDVVGDSSRVNGRNLGNGSSLNSGNGGGSVDRGDGCGGNGQGLSGCRKLVVDASWEGEGHGGEGEDDEGVHF
jgi:hypothetical protein